MNVSLLQEAPLRSLLIPFVPKLGGHLSLVFEPELLNGHQKPLLTKDG